MKHPAQWFLDRLEGVEGSSDQLIAWCPAHPDIGTGMKGLSITVKSEWDVLVHCHSCGADIKQVADALEGDDPYATETDWHPTITKNGKKEDTEPAHKGKTGLAWWEEKTGIPSTTWEALGVKTYATGVAFTFAGMDLLKIRRPPKEFAWAGTGERPPLWPMPEDELPEEIAITEGESDCGTLRHVGIHAYAITAGAGKSRNERRYLTEAHFQALWDRGARKVILCGDADPSGAEMMAQMADVATSAGFEVSVLRLDIVLDPFSGLNDLNGMWREAGPELFGDLLQRAIQKLAAAMPVLTLVEMLTIADEEVDWLIPGLVAPSDKILLSGPQKSYKTWIALELARSMLMGVPFLKRFEWQPTRTCKKGMFVQEEGSRQLWARRIRKLGLPLDAPLIFWHRKGFRFTDPEKVAQLIDTCRREEVEVLFLDPLQRMMPGVNENDSSETGIVWDEVQRIQEAVPGIVICILHHSNKSERLTWESIRGSSRHAGEVDLGLFLEKHPVEDHTVRVAVDGRDIPQYLGTGESFEVRVDISTDEQEQQGDYHFFADGTEIKPNVTHRGKIQGKQNRDRVLSAIREGNDTRTKLMHSCDLSDSTVREHLQDLIADNIIEETDNGAGKPRTYEAVEDKET